MEEKYRVRITKTKKEWKAIDRRLKELSPRFDFEKDLELKPEERRRKNTERFSKHLNNNISHLIQDYKNCPECIKQLFPQRNFERQKGISPIWYEELCKISLDVGVSISTLIDRCIITPLLIEKS